jgi:hypothetical protein
LCVILAAALVLLPLRNLPWYESRLRRPLAALVAVGGLWLMAGRI